MAEKPKTADWRRTYRPYIVAAVLAFVMTMFIAPERMEGNAMNPTVKDGQMIVLQKEKFSVKRGLPETGTVVVLAKNVLPESGEDNAVRRVSRLPGETVDLGEKKIVVGEDEVFVTCDYGEGGLTGESVKLKDIRGVAKWIIWPLSDLGKIE